MSRTRAIAASIILALTAGAPLGVRAQDDGQGEPQAAPVRREHPDLALARTLGYGYGWFDLAFDVLDLVDKARPGADVVKEARLLRAELQTQAAAAQRDPAKREELLKKARGFLEEQAKSGSVEAQLKLGEMLLSEGDGAFTRMRTAEDGESRAQARKEAEEKYAQAEKFFEELIGKLEKALEDADRGTDQAKKDEAFYKHMVGRFNHAMAINQHAQLLEKGAKEREERLKKCYQLFAQFNEDYAQQPLGYEAAIRLGLAAKELGRTREAVAAFDSAIGIKDFFQNDQGGYTFDESSKDIVARAVYFKSQMLNELRDFDAALKSVKELFDLIPDMRRDRLGYAARVEEGKAWGGKGEVRKAVEVLERVAEDDKNGPWAASAKEQIAIIQGGGGTGAVTIAPERAIPSAEAAIDRGKPAEGLNQLRFLIAALEQSTNQDEQAKWLPYAWFKLGNAYSGLRRYDEAVACFTALAVRFKGSDQAADGLFQKAMALAQLNGARPNDLDKKEYLDTLEALQRDYPKHPAAQAASFFKGIDLFASRDYLNAAKEFEKTTEKAGKIFDAAVYQAGLSYVMEGRRLAAEKKPDEAKPAFSQARIALERAIRWASEDAAKRGSVEGDRAEMLKKVAFDARCRLAEVSLHSALKEPAKALEAADAAERGLGEGADPERVATARLLKVQAYLGSDDVANAEQVCASMGADCPTSPRTAQAEREVAIAVDKQAEAAKNDGRKDDAKALFGKAADHYVRWFDATEKASVEVPAKDLSKAGNRLYTIALAVNGLADNTESFSEVEDLAKLEAPARFVEAARVYKAALDAGSAEPDVRILLGECYGFGGKFAEAGAALDAAVKAEKLLKVEKDKDENGKPIEVISIDVKVANARNQALTAYFDYGRCCYELIAKDPKLTDECVSVMARLLGAVPAGHRLWWGSKYYLFAGLYEKGEYDDASIGMKQLERQNPDFDKGTFKPKFLELKKRLEGKKSPGRPPASGGSGKKTK